MHINEFWDEINTIKNGDQVDTLSPKWELLEQLSLNYIPNLPTSMSKSIKRVHDRMN